MKDINHITLLFLIIFTLIKTSFNANTTIAPIILNFYTKASNSDNFTEENYNSNLYSYIMLGSNKQKVEMRMQLDKYTTYITQKSAVNPLYNSYTYDNTTSTSYKFIEDCTSFYYDDFNAASISNETLFTDNKNLENFTFAYTSKINYNVISPAGSIGLGYTKQSFYGFTLNFMDQLKKNNLISGYGITINYTSRDEGNFIIGPEFNEIDGNDKKYNSTIYYRSQTEYSSLWGLTFNYVKVGEQTLNYSKNANLNINMEYIKATDDYTTKIVSMFFANLINVEKKCVALDISNQIDFKAIRCDKDTKIENFPDLIFNLGAYDEPYSFNFTYKDLFELKDNYYYFKILLVDKNDPTIIISASWDFGRIFFRKFIVTLNKDKKTITFYNKIDDGNGGSDGNKKNEVKSYFNMLNIILGVVLLAILVILFFVGFKFWEQNKKIKNKERKNVLLDEEDAFVDFTKNEKLTETINES